MLVAGVYCLYLLALSGMLLSGPSVGHPLNLPLHKAGAAVSSFIFSFSMFTVLLVTYFLEMHKFRRNYYGHSVLGRGKMRKELKELTENTKD